MKIYDLMEFIVFQLKFIPHRELVNLSILLKSERSDKVNRSDIDHHGFFIHFSSIHNHKNCVKFLIHILKFNNAVKDALRELGFIEVLIARLRHFATLLKESIQNPNGKQCIE